jgi:acetoin utilization deacetylase AcuC-like enzyme
MLVLVSSDRFADHLPPPGHPERVARAHVMQAVSDHWASRGVPVLAPRPATAAELLRVHTPAYLDRIAATAGRAVKLDADTFTSRDTAEVAALAAGASIVGVDAVLDRAGTTLPDAGHPDVSFALVLVRPPGHHAEAARAMGFCIYNNVAVAAAHALARGCARVAIVDYDVHHGNGTERIFYTDRRVLFISTHQFPFYPGTGAAEETGAAGGEGFTVNVPIEAGATDGDYLLVFDRVILPVLRAFQPDLLLVSAGFDAHMRDPLAGMRMSVAGFNDLGRRLYALASVARCPAVFITEGGYHLKVLGACLDGLVGVLLDRRDKATTSSAVAKAVPARVSGKGPDAEPLTPDDLPLSEEVVAGPSRRGAAAVQLVRAVQQRYWPGL